MKGNPILGHAKGRIGTLTTALVKGQQVTRVYNPSPKNPRTRKQMLQRVKFYNVTASAGRLIDVITGAFESLPANQNDGNAFVSRNLAISTVYLTKSEADGKGCVAGPYTISQGSKLNPIQLVKQGNALVSNIAVPSGFTIENETTLGAVSFAMMSANPQFVSGDKITLVFVEQLKKVQQSVVIPHIEVSTCDFVLKPGSTTVFYSLVPKALFQVVSSFIGTGSDLKEGGVAFIRSRAIQKKIHVSSADIALTPNNTTYAKYSTETQLERALESYGTAELNRYDPDAEAVTRHDDEDEGDDTQFSVTSVTLNGVTVSRGSGSINIGTGDLLEIKGHLLTDVEIKARAQTDPTGDPENFALSALGTVTTGEKVITITVTASEAEVFYLFRADTSAVIYNFS